MSDSVTVATSGKTVDRNDKCERCGEPMLYRMDGERIDSMFCANLDGGVNDWCPRALVEIYL